MIEQRNDVAMVGVPIRRDCSPEEAIELVMEDTGCTRQQAELSYWVNRTLFDLLKVNSAAHILSSAVIAENGHSIHTNLANLLLTSTGTVAQESMDGLSLVVRELIIQDAECRRVP